MQVARFSCGRRDPRRIQLAGPLKAKSFAPRAGLLRKQPVHGAALCRCHTFLVLWEARPAANAACRPAHAKSFAQGSGLPRSSPCVAPPDAAGTLFLWEARPAANTACRPAQSQKLRPGDGAPTKAARAWRHYVQPGLPRQHVAQLQAIAGMQIGQLRPKIFRQVYQHASRARRFGAFQVEAVVADHHQFPRRHGPAVRQM